MQQDNGWLKPLYAAVYLLRNTNIYKYIATYKDVRLSTKIHGKHTHASQFLG